MRTAQRALRETWLVFARGAAVVAIALASLAYVSNTVSPHAWTAALRASAAHAATNSDYRAVWLPTN